MGVSRRTIAAQVAREPAGARCFVDRGGTFTDVIHDDGSGRLRASKHRSSEAVVGRLASGTLTVGTTVVTNAILEGNLARVLLFVSAGFADLVHLGDMTRPALFDPDLRRPGWPGLRVVEVRGRIDGGGAEVEPLVMPTFDVCDVDAVAVVLLNSAQNPAHELALAAGLPVGVPVSLGHRLAPRVGYQARLETTLLDAAATPVLRAAQRRDELRGDALAIRSDASTCVAAALRAPDAVLSGPAGGVLAVEHVARVLGADLAVGLDMGGTSTDVCLVQAGKRAWHGTTFAVAGRRVARPAVEVHTIAAGGGSVLGHDGVGYTVGPASAGADPGPQVYGRGGPPTLTDAAVVAGLVDPASFGVPIDTSCVSLPGPPEAFIEVARESMAAAVKHLALARGIDVRSAVLVAYGGAAGQHACAVAERLGIAKVAVHALASVLSAFGQRFARREEEVSRAVWRALGVAWTEVESAWAACSAALADLGDQERWVELRYQGTDHALRVRATTPPAARAQFESEHRARYGFVRPELGLEVVQAGVRARDVAVRADYVATWPPGTPIQVEGPARLSLAGTSLVVPAGWRGHREGALFVLEGGGEASAPRPPGRDLGLALWGARFTSIAAGAGEVLRALARSVNIRERLDFSCAVFDGAGRLVANAPHVPVHLGAMGVTVRDVLAAHPAPVDGDAWLSNDPAAGGSHLPDLTVVTAVVSGGHRWFVANRAHHVDVGGLTPGSMPPTSRTLAEEGTVFRRHPLVQGGRLCLPDLEGCRDVATVSADLRAQVAANVHAARALRALDPGELDRWMHALLVAVEAAASALLPSLRGEAADEIDGTPLRLRVDGARFDFTGTGGPHPGNLNAPPGVVRAAVLYALRLLMGRDLPLNEGALAPLAIVVPPGCILDPPPGAAVVGGNVETSQRVVDLVLRAVGARAASMGTMNNLSLGGEGWAYYETLGGGLGAHALRPGASGLQVHMTNTRATDPEVIEVRLPLRVVQFKLRRGSGGAGRFPGGDGLVRELELREGGTASLLAAWRPGGAPGERGGGAGAAGEAWVRRDGTWQRWDGHTVALQAGDRVRVLTPGGGGWGSRGAG